MLAEEGEQLAPAIHRLLGPVDRPVPIEEAVAGAVIAIELVTLAVLLQLGLVLVHRLGARSSLPNRPISGHERSLVISIGATGVLALSSSAPITTRPPQSSAQASTSLRWHA